MSDERVIPVEDSEETVLPSQEEVNCANIECCSNPSVIDVREKDTPSADDQDSNLECFKTVLDKEIDVLAESVGKSKITSDIDVQAGGDAPLQKEAVSQKSKKLVDESDNTSITQIYRLKWIEWHHRKTPIVTQNENGPCPLIAIANILLLRGKINLQATLEYVCASDLMDYIGNSIMESIPKDLTGATLLNYEQNMHDAIAILPQLHTGLDVNVKFTGVQHFEYTPECIIFDLLNIPLYHGWLVDPQCHETVKALGNLGYNQLVEKIILNKGSADADLVTEALIAEQFLEKTASQLTYHGLCELSSAMQREELAVLFRNNHFSTIFKKKVCMDRGEVSAPLPVREELHELFQLVTDQGFLHEPHVVWETLCNIEGDGQFVDCRFATVPPKAAITFIPDTALTEEQQINQDYLMALSLQEEEETKMQDESGEWDEYGNTHSSPDVSDEELARRMQEEQQTLQVSGRTPSPSSSTNGRLPPSPGGERGKKGSMCNVI